MPSPNQPRRHAQPAAKPRTCLGPCLCPKVPQGFSLGSLSSVPTKWALAPGVCLPQPAPSSRSIRSHAKDLPRPLPLPEGTPRLQPWVSQFCPHEMGFSPWGMPSPTSPVVPLNPQSRQGPAFALAFARRYPKASALGLSVSSHETGFSPWGMSSPTSPVVPLNPQSRQGPAFALAVARRYPKASALGLSVSSHETGFSPWSMPSPNQHRRSIQPAAKPRTCLSTTPLSS